jgi:hypothetical protein
MGNPIPRNTVQPSGTVTFLFTDIEGSTPKERLIPTVVSVPSGVYREMLLFRKRGIM